MRLQGGSVQEGECSHCSRRLLLNTSTVVARQDIAYGVQAAAPQRDGTNHSEKRKFPLSGRLLACFAMAEAWQVMGGLSTGSLSCVSSQVVSAIRKFT